VFDAQTIVIDPTDHYAYVSTGGADSIAQFNIEADGSLSPMSPAYVDIGTASEPVGLAIDPSGSHVYTALTGDGEIDQFAIAQGGTLSALTPPYIDLGFETLLPENIVFDHSGQNAYVPLGNMNQVFQYAIGAGGILSAKPLSTADVYGGPKTVGIDPTHHFAYVPSVHGSVIDQFNIRQDGSLVPMNPPYVDAGFGDPVGLTVVPATRTASLCQNNSGGNPPECGTSSNPCNLVLDCTFTVTLEDGTKCTFEGTGLGQPGVVPCASAALFCT
jgi:6-phosphogluconolactonase